MAVLPCASFAVTVTLVATPAVTEPGPVTASVVAGPGVKVTVVELAIAELLRVPVMVAVPAVVEEVRVAV